MIIRVVSVVVLSNRKYNNNMIGNITINDFNYILL